MMKFILHFIGLAVVCVGVFSATSILLTTHGQIDWPWAIGVSLALAAANTWRRYRRDKDSVSPTA